jgi:hypothetical protein
MINILTEQLQTLAQAAQEMPGGAIHPSTIHRWHHEGCRGVLLETVLRGGVRYTSKEAVQRFVAAVTEAARRPGHPEPAA